MTVAREVLGNEVQLDDAAPGEVVGLFDDVGDGTAALFAAQRGDDAEGAGVVAALGDLQVRRVAGHRVGAGQVAAGDEGEVLGDLVSRLHRFAVDDGQAALGLLHGLAKAKARQHVFDLGVVRRAEEGVDLGEFALEFADVALGHAARDDQLGAGLGLQQAHLEDGLDRLLLGLADEAAGVDDDGVGLFRALHHGVTTGHRDAKHMLGVDAVFGTAERDKMNLCHSRDVANGATEAMASPAPSARTASDKQERSGRVG